MNEAEIRKYAELMRELDLTGLEVTENGCVVRLERTPAAPVLPRETVAVPPAPPGSRGCAPGRDHGGHLSHGGGLLRGPGRERGTLCQGGRPGETGTDPVHCGSDEADE